MSYADAVDRIVDVSSAPRARSRVPVSSAHRRLRFRRPVQEYEPGTPRAALGALAVAVTVVTLVALVLVPAALESVAHTLY